MSQVLQLEHRSMEQYTYDKKLLSKQTKNKNNTKNNTNNTKTKQNG